MFSGFDLIWLFAVLFANSLCEFLWLWTLPVQICSRYRGNSDPTPSVQLQDVSDHQLDEISAVLLCEKMNRVYVIFKKQLGNIL